MDFINIKNLIVNSEVVGYGAYGYVLRRDNFCYKIDLNLYKKFKENNIDENQFLDLILCSKNGWYIYPKIDLINYYDSIRDKVKYTKLPRGIVYYKEYPILLKMDYHENYVNLPYAFLFNKEIYQILFNITRAYRELLENNVYQLDFCCGHNIMVNEITKDVQLIDLDGYNIRYGKDCHDKCNSYIYFYEMIYDWLKESNVNVDISYFRTYTDKNFDDMLDYTKKVLIKEGKLY